MASTQIEIALADDDRKRIDRICRVMLVNTGKPYLQSLDLAWHLSHKLSGAIADAKANADLYSKRGDHDISGQFLQRIVAYENVIRWMNELEEIAARTLERV